MKSNIKKLGLILGLLIIVLLVQILRSDLSSNKQATLQVSGGDFVVKNIKNGGIQIISDSVDEIQIDLKGPRNELDNINFNQLDGGLSEFSIPDDSVGITGIIRVPNYITVVNLDLPPSLNRPNLNRSRNRQRTSELFGNRLNQTNEISNGQVSIGGGSGNPILENNSETQSSSNNNSDSNNTSDNQSSSDQSNNNSNQGSSEGGNENQESNQNNNQNENNNPPPAPPASCGDNIIQPQLGESCDDGNNQSGDGCSANCIEELPDAVCGNGFVEGLEECDDGNTINDDICSNDCVLDVYQKFIGEKCTLEIAQEERNLCCQINFENEPHDTCEGSWIFDYHSRLCIWDCPQENCGAKATAIDRDNCCKNKHQASTTPPCDGEWIFGNGADQCIYQCLSYPEVTDRRTLDEINQTSQYCTTIYEDNEGQSSCCDLFLSHPLSIGPREGYPDCIGKWQVIPGKNRCEFQCSDYGEMIEILKLLQSEQEN